MFWYYVTDESFTRVIEKLKIADLTYLFDEECSSKVWNQSENLFRSYKIFAAGI